MLYLRLPPARGGIVRNRRVPYQFNGGTTLRPPAPMRRNMQPPPPNRVEMQLDDISVDNILFANTVLLLRARTRYVYAQPNRLSRFLRYRPVRDFNWDRMRAMATLCFVSEFWRITFVRMSMILYGLRDSSHVPVLPVSDGRKPNILVIILLKSYV